MRLDFHWIQHLATRHTTCMKYAMRSQMRHLQPVDDAVHKIGGLSFNAPLFKGSTEHITPTLNQSDVQFLEQHLLEHRANPVLTQINQPVNLQMGQQRRWPILLNQIELPNLHEDLVRTLDNRGVMDMWIKIEGSNELVLPIELRVLKPILSEIFKAERFLNKEFRDWNGWLLVDTRRVTAGHTQRNAGFHYDGLNLGGKYRGTKLVSIYGWFNKLPTLFLTETVKFPHNFDGTKDNASIFPQRQLKNPNDIVAVPINTIVKFDGACAHAGSVAEESIEGRVFIRVCFTPPGVLFDRKGNTHNPAPCFDYSDVRWERNVPDPAVQWRNCVEFRNPQEFKNMWDVACHGHSAFAIETEGVKSHEYQLMKKIREARDPRFLKKVFKLYDQDIARSLSLEAKVSFLIKKELLEMRFSINSL